MLSLSLICVGIARLGNAIVLVTGLYMLTRVCSGSYVVIGCPLSLDTKKPGLYRAQLLLSFANYPVVLISWYLELD